MKRAISTTQVRATTGKKFAGVSAVACMAFACMTFASAAVRAVTITEYAISTPNSAPQFITAGPDGNLWFTELFGNKIGRITSTGGVTEFAIPTSNSMPHLIAVGADGNLWFAEFAANKIGKITTGGGVTEYPVPTVNGGPSGITAGPDGNLWFTEALGNQIGRITTAGAVTEFPIPTANSGPGGIAAGPDGNLWFTEQVGNRIGSITTGGVISEYSIPTPSSLAVGIAAGPDGNLWFTEVDGNQIGKITDGVITEYAIPAVNSMPFGITAGPDGNLWFAEYGGNQIGTITTGGSITEYPVPTVNSQPAGIALGADGNIWFTEQNANKIGKVTLATTTSTGSSVTVATSMTFFNTKSHKEETAVVDVTFASVTSGGTTAVTATSTPTDVPPTSYTANIGLCSKTKKLGCETDDDCPSGQTCVGYHGIAFDLTTTAVVSGPITVCSHYADNEKRGRGNGYVDGTGKPGLPEESLRLLHKEGGVFVDITLPGYPDKLDNVVCGQVSSLSAADATDARAARAVAAGDYQVSVHTDMPGGKDLNKLGDDCMTEWSVGDPKAGNPTTPRLTRGGWTRPDAKLTCTLGSKKCEATRATHCKFRFRICLNVKDDPRLPCTPTDVREFQLLEPELADPPTDDSVIALRILEKLEELPGSNRFDTQVRFDSALTSPVCTNNIEVETVANAAGKLIKLAAFDDNHARKDTNYLKLLCKP